MLLFFKKFPGGQHSYNVSFPHLLPQPTYWGAQGVYGLNAGGRGKREITDAGGEASKKKLGNSCEHDHPWIEPGSTSNKQRAKTKAGCNKAVITGRFIAQTEQTPSLGARGQDQAASHLSRLRAEAPRRDRHHPAVRCAAEYAMTL